jgi:hypothetical protein
MKDYGNPDIYRTACSIFQGAVYTHDVVVISAVLQAADMHHETEFSCSLLWLILDEDSLFATVALFKEFIFKHLQWLLID